MPKKIQTVQIWNNGANKNASWLNSSCTDNLDNTATFFYQLAQDFNGQMGNVLASGYLTMTGQDYNNFNDNDYAYNWVAQQLSLTIIS